MSAAILTARAVTKSFGSTPALRAASLTVARAEVLAIMGPSGSGKSTLLHCLAGILSPDAGEVTFDGRCLNTMSENERTLVRRDRFGFVFQFDQLVPELPVLENVMLPLLLGHARRRAARDAATALLDRWTSPACIGAVRVSCPAGRRSGSRWHGRSSPSHRWCSPTNRPDHWTPSPGRT
jgi:putative ABC transport system ATP-binding protein